MYMYYVVYSVCDGMFNAGKGYACINLKKTINNFDDIEELKAELEKIVVKKYKEQNRKLPDDFDIIILNFIRL